MNQDIRKNERNNLMFLLYQMDIKNDYILRPQDVEDFSVYQNTVINHFLSNRDELDLKLNKVLQMWNTASVGKIELAVLRLALTEILYMDDIPNPVVINEAVEIAKTYGDEKSHKFVNAILRNFV